MIDPTKPVRAYRSPLPTLPRWTIEQGPVMERRSDVALHVCRFVVDQQLRGTAITGDRRNVHAWVEGVLTDDPGDCQTLAWYDLTNGCFRTEDGEPVVEAEAVVLGAGPVRLRKQGSCNYPQMRI